MTTHCAAGNRCFQSGAVRTVQKQRSVIIIKIHMNHFNIYSQHSGWAVIRHPGENGNVSFRHENILLCYVQIINSTAVCDHSPLIFIMRHETASRMTWSGELEKQMSNQASRSLMQFDSFQTEMKTPAPDDSCFPLMLRVTPPHHQCRFSATQVKLKVLCPAWAWRSKYATLYFHFHGQFLLIFDKPTGCWGCAKTFTYLYEIVAEDNLLLISFCLAERRLRIKATCFDL